MDRLESNPILVSARAHASSGDWAAVASLLEAGATGARPDPTWITLYGEALMRTGRAREARDWLDGVRPGLDFVRDGAEMRRVENLFGAACFAVGDLDEATRAFGHALDLASQTDDPLVMARATNNLGAIANLRGNPELALWHYMLALPLYQRLGEARGLAESYHNIAITHRDRGEFDRADEHERRSMEFAAGAGADRLLTMARIGRAEIALHRGDARLAEASARVAIARLLVIGDRANEADARRLLATALVSQGRIAEGSAEFDEALSIARQFGHALTEAETLRDRSRMHTAAGDVAAAGADRVTAIELFERLGARREADRLRGPQPHLD